TAFRRGSFVVPSCGTRRRGRRGHEAHYNDQGRDRYEECLSHPLTLLAWVDPDGLHHQATCLHHPPRCHRGHKRFAREEDFGPSTASPRPWIRPVSDRPPATCR